MALKRTKEMYWPDWMTKDKHKNYAIRKMTQRKGGVRPLSRMHPAHPCWHGGRKSEFVPANQQFER